jgi:hypothetical protein
MLLIWLLLKLYFFLFFLFFLNEWYFVIILTIMNSKYFFFILSYVIIFFFKMMKLRSHIRLHFWKRKTMLVNHRICIIFNSWGIISRFYTSIMAWSAILSIQYLSLAHILWHLLCKSTCRFFGIATINKWGITWTKLLRVFTSIFVTFLRLGCKCGLHHFVSDCSSFEVTLKNLWIVKSAYSISAFQH